MRGHYKLYQDNWNGIDLVKISNKLGIPVNCLAMSEIYGEFYKELRVQVINLTKDGFCQNVERVSG